jgi:hypothetical protein
VIERFCLEKLNKLFKVRYGNHPKPAVQIQRAAMERRIERFAVKQAEHFNEGWRIIKTEFGCNKNDRVVILDGEQALYLNGRIDRLDFTANTGTYAILDYKSGDAGKSPEAVHRQGTKEKEWVSFQLPLYHHILRHTEHFAVKPNYLPVEPTWENIQLGYFILPKDDAVKVEFAKWSPEELKKAIDECRGIAEKIRSGQFAMSSDPPKYENFPELVRLKRK